MCERLPSARPLQLCACVQSHQVKGKPCLACHLRYRDVGHVANAGGPESVDKCVLNSVSPPPRSHYLQLRAMWAPPAFGDEVQSSSLPVSALVCSMGINLRRGSGAHATPFGRNCPIAKVMMVAIPCTPSARNPPQD